LEEPQLGEGNDRPLTVITGDRKTRERRAQHRKLLTIQKAGSLYSINFVIRSWRRRHMLRGRRNPELGDKGIEAAS